MTGTPRLVPAKVAKSLQVLAELHPLLYLTFCPLGLPAKPQDRQELLAF